MTHDPPTTTPARVLLVEDNPADARLVREALKDAAAARPLSRAFDLQRVESLADALTHLCDGSAEVDLILLDLTLPDSQGLETFLTLRDREPDIPVVVLTGFEDEALAEQAVRAGAQDYLNKGELDPPLLARSLAYAVERVRADRQRLQLLREQNARAEAERQRDLARAEAALQQAQKELAEAEARRAIESRERQERELRALEQLSHATRTPITSSYYGAAPLRVSQPAAFADLVEQYAVLLDRALEERVYRVSHRTSERLREMAARLGFLRSGPRDVVDIHTTALKQRLAGAVPERSQAYVEEARVLVLELMGYLVSHYRGYTMAATP